jgi:two-component system, cell cycle sensor histidine kinase and response regulator CckA
MSATGTGLACVEDEREQLLGELEDLLGRLASLPDKAGSGDKVVLLPDRPGFEPPMTWTTDLDLRFSSAWGSLARTGGATPSALPGRSLGELLDSDDPEHPLVRCHREAMTGRTVFFRSCFRDSLWFNHLAPLRERDGRVRGAIGFAFQVGEAKEGWAARRASARRFRAVVSSAPVGVAVLSLEGQVIECNPALANLLDYSAEEILRMGVAGLSHPDDLMLDVHLFAELIEGRRDRYRIEKRYFRRDGSIVWCNLTVSLVRGEQDTPELVIAIVEDVTERKRTVEALRESEAKFRGVYESGMLGIVLLDPSGNMTDANEAFLQMVGYDRKQLAQGGVRWRDLTPPEFAALDNRALAELLDRGMCTPFEKEYIRCDGKRVPVLVGGAFLDSGRKRAAAFVLDVSEKRRLEAQYQQAQRLEVLGRLAGGVAHDFNNILTSVLANVDLVSNALLPWHPGRRDLLEIQEAALRAAHLTKQLLAFSSKQVLQPTVLDIDALVQGMESLLRKVIREDVALSTDLDARGARVRADGMELERALMNLVVNGRDAITGAGRITIRTRRVEQVDSQGIHGDATLGGPCVSVSVEDSGSGMDAQTQAHVFEPFFSTKTPGQGTGLGLAIVYGVVQQSGGGIRVDSALGRGTTFEILLPETATPLTLASAARPVGSARGSGTILVAEDDPLVLSVTSKILSGNGYEVIAASNPDAALSASARHHGPIHLLVSDLIMPGMSGVDLAVRVRRLHPETKVLYMSAYAGDALPIVSQNGIEPSLLTKPFAQSELCAKVREIMGRPLARPDQGGPA